jgi:hypothetical protein
MMRTLDLTRLAAGYDWRSTGGGTGILLGERVSGRRPKEGGIGASVLWSTREPIRVDWPRMGCRPHR